MPFHCQTKPPVIFRQMNGEYVVTRKAQGLEELFKEEGGDINSSPTPSPDQTL